MLRLGTFLRYCLLVALLLPTAALSDSDAEVQLRGAKWCVASGTGVACFPDGTKLTKSFAKGAHLEVSTAPGALSMFLYVEFLCADTCMEELPPQPPFALVTSETNGELLVREFIDGLTDDSGSSARVFIITMPGQFAVHIAGGAVETTRGVVREFAGDWNSD